jgi:hypothetical protein
MDPTTLILTALATGASVAAKDTASDIIKDTYQGLKTLIQRKFAGKPVAQELVEKHEQQPEEVKAALGREISENKISDDAEVLTKARELLELQDPEGVKAGKYQINIHNSQGVIGHSQGPVHMDFRRGSGEKGCD